MSVVNFGVSADKIGEWVLVDMLCTDRTQHKTYRTGKRIPAVDYDGLVMKDDDGKTIMIDEERILLQRSAIWTLVRKRKLIGVSKFKPENGQTEKSFALMTGPETEINYTSIGHVGAEKKYLCTSDKLTPTNIVLGTSEQVQTWIHMGPWKNIPEKVFE